MIDIRNKSECCGCTACMSVCPVQCIIMRRDREEGFDYPVANPDLCISCGKCENVCPVINPREKHLPLKTFASRSKRYVQTSSSGGIFPELAESVIAEGGVVYGAAFDEDFKVEHREVTSVEDIRFLQGSKYVQSELYSTFEDVGQVLEDGGNVLFAGTPCQVAGLKNYLGKEYERLLTMDFACHGVPGPGLWEMYLDTLRKRYGKIVELNFRDKSRSWFHYDFKVNDKTVPYMKDPYMALFVQDITLRPSCYSCPVRDGRSGSDITLGDLWSVASIMPDMNDDEGLSLVCVNTEKGKKALESLEIELKEVDFNAARLNNRGFSNAVAIPEKRSEFFKGIHSTADLYSYMKRFVVRPPLWKMLRGFLYKFKRKLLS